MTLTPSPPTSAVGHERVELYLYSPYGPHGLYRASVPVQGCTIYLLQLIGYFQLSYGRHNNIHKLAGKYYVLYIQLSIRIIVPKHLNRHYLHENTVHIQMGRSQWSRGIRRGSAAARLLELWVQSRLGYRCLSF